VPRYQNDKLILFVPTFFRFLFLFLFLLQGGEIIINRSETNKTSVPALVCSVPYAAISNLTPLITSQPG